MAIPAIPSNPTTPTSPAYLNQMLFTQIGNYSFPSTVGVINTAGYSILGLGAARYRRITSNSTTAATLFRTQSADGSWWELDEHQIDPTMCGAKANGKVFGDLQILSSSNLYAATFYSNTHTFTQADVGAVIVYSNASNCFYVPQITTIAAVTGPNSITLTNPAPGTGTYSGQSGSDDSTAINAALLLSGNPNGPWLGGANPTMEEVGYISLDGVWQHGGRTVVFRAKGREMARYCTLSTIRLNGGQAARWEAGAWLCALPGFNGVSLLSQGVDANYNPVQMDKLHAENIQLDCGNGYCSIGLNIINCSDCSFTGGITVLGALDIGVNFYFNTTSYRCATYTISGGVRIENIGINTQMTFTGALVAATSATLTAVWPYPTGIYPAYFSNNTNQFALLTQNSTAVSWTTAVTATATVDFGSINSSNVVVQFTAGLAAATSATLGTSWAYPTGVYTVKFEDGSTRSVTLTNGATTATWSGAVTASLFGVVYSLLPTTFTGSLVAATSATLSSNWLYPTGSYIVKFSDGSYRYASFTLNNATVTWTGAVTATASININTNIGKCIGMFNGGSDNSLDEAKIQGYKIGFYEGGSNNRISGEAHCWTGIAGGEMLYAFYLGGITNYYGRLYVDSPYGFNGVSGTTSAVGVLLAGACTINSVGCTINTTSSSTGAVDNSLVLIRCISTTSWGKNVINNVEVTTANTSAVRWQGIVDGNVGSNGVTTATLANLIINNIVAQTNSYYYMNYNTTIFTAQTAISYQTTSINSLQTQVNNLQLTSAGGSWIPNIISSEVLAWFDVSNTASMIFNGNNVSTINSLIGNGALANYNSAGQPTYNATGFNSVKPALIFNGTSQMLSATSANLITNQLNIRIFVVIQPQNITSTNYLMCIPNSSTTEYYNLRMRMTSNTAGDIGNVGSGTLGFTPTAATPFLVTTGMSIPSSTLGSTVTQYVRFNGATGAITSGTAGTSGNVTSNLLTIGGANYISAFGTLGLAEIIVLTGTPGANDSEDRKIEGYLAWKWGIQTSLPVGHPYYSAAPYVPPSITSANFASALLFG
ncbi:MAG: hypothetical protein P4L79_11050 [Legionella sp.]|uniref:hypothetical protein n=1 Tax=Legionella sp. TaxID=459 RepID=UPI002851CCAB|nr:hypothetical protein [Legionella sp.]